MYPIANLCDNFITKGNTMKIVIIGAGNVATLLGRKIKHTSHSIIQVISHTFEHAKILGEELGCPFTDFSGTVNADADIYLFAIADSHLQDMHEHFKLGDKIVLHTAGAVAKNILEGVSVNYGVLYPLQSLNKKIDTVPEIPLLIDANNASTLSVVESFAKDISGQVQHVTDEDRQRLHVAAVFVNNFTNHLYQVAAEYCEKEKVDFNLLKPLILETAQRIIRHSPQEVQTGPAIRNDVFTLQKHLQLLANHAKQKYLYMKLTDSIINK